MGDLFKVTAPSGLKLRSAPSTTDGAVIIFAMLPGTIVEALGASSPDDPHFVAVHVELNQPGKFIMQDGEQPSTPADQGYVSEEGFASADWLVPIGQSAPEPEPGPGVPPAVATASAASGGAGVMLLLVAIVAAALYAAK
jgi:hypothetical protein